MKNRIKKGAMRWGWRFSPETMAAVEQLHAYRAEVAELRHAVAELRREIDESRRDSLRVAELTDLVVERLAAAERAGGDAPHGDEGEATASTP
ncbi:DUF6752 domain-containing protein [Agromyces bauzanensis]